MKIHLKLLIAVLITIVIGGGIIMTYIQSKNEAVSPASWLIKAKVPDEPEGWESPFAIHVGFFPGFGYRLAADIGAKFAHEAIGWWNTIEPEKGVFRWEVIDAYATAAQESDISLLPIIRSISDWGCSRELSEANKKPRFEPRPWSGFPRDDLEAYKNFLTRLVERFDGDGYEDMPGLRKPIKHWKIENEFAWNWLGTKEELVSLLRTANATIKAADPEAKVVLGGTAETLLGAYIDGMLDEPLKKSRFSWLRSTLENFSKDPEWISKVEMVKNVLAHGGNSFDIVTIHLYEPYEFIEYEIEWLRREMLKNGYQKPIWATEVGGPNIRFAGVIYSERINAEEVVKRYTLGIASGIKKIFWSTLAPTPEWGEVFTNMALLEGARKKLSYHTYKLMAIKLMGFTAVEKINLAKETYAFRFDKKDEPIYILWSENSDRAELNLETGQVRITDIRGVEEIRETNNGNIILTLTESPIFLEPI